MNRSDFQRLAEVRLKEAEALLAAGLWDGAYYLAGYAVECGLKACIAKLTQAGDFPPKPELVRDYYSHDLTKLLRAAGLEPAPRVPLGGDLSLDRNWRLCLLWSEQARYFFHGESAARELVVAINDATTGVLPWLTQRW